MLSTLISRGFRGIINGVSGGFPRFPGVSDHVNTKTVLATIRKSAFRKGFPPPEQNPYIILISESKELERFVAARGASLR